MWATKLCGLKKDVIKWLLNLVSWNSVPKSYDLVFLSENCAALLLLKSRVRVQTKFLFTQFNYYY